MIYANTTINSESFPDLMQAFSDYGVRKESIEIAEQYLNLENPRDNSLLEKIQEQDFFQYNSVYGAKWQALTKAIKKEIIRPNSEELLERYFLLIQAIAGVSCAVLGMYEIGSDYAKRTALILKAFQSRFGEDAEAVYLAIRVSGRGNNVYTVGVYGIETDDVKPEICLKAFTYCTHYYAKIRLLISAMNQIVPKEQFNIQNIVKALLVGNQCDDLAQQAMKCMDEEIIPASTQIPEKSAYIVALALASGYDKKYFSLFEKEFQNRQSSIAEYVLKSNKLDKERVLNVMESCTAVSLKYISLIANTATEGERYWENVLKTRDAHLKKLAQKYPSAFKQQMNAEKNVMTARNMEKILSSVDKSYQGGDTLRDKARRNCADLLTERNPDKKYEIEKFLFGSMSMEEFLKIAPELKMTALPYYSREKMDYISAYGMDDFAERCVCYRMMIDYESYHPLISLPGIVFENHEAQVIDILRKQGVPLKYILNGTGEISNDTIQIMDRIIKKLQEYADEVAELDLKDLNIPARRLKVRILAEKDSKKYQKALFACAEDSSKVVKGLALQYLPELDNTLNPEILDLLNGKKISKREIALALLEKNFPECYREAVQKAFEAEKSEKLKTRFAVLLNGEATEIKKQAASESIVDEYSKGNKARKVAWIFENPFTPVHDKDGNEVEEKYLIALTNIYASMDIFKLTRSEIADKLAENLNQNELERFAQEVFSRFIDKGAEAKQRWAIYFTAIYGGFDAIASIQHYIKDWSEHSRGAIASDAVKALAINGSSAALMAVDQMARKFKHRQVRSAAGTALHQAAEALNITREELADKIVPDLGFDETLCRIFDYGARQFKVYLTPALELEIFEGEKKLKTLPKPGKNDDSEKAEKASKDFKEMKKQMKTVVQNQKARLEYVLLCDRKWTADGWKELFIKKPVMHCFAIGLIWGAYDEQDNLLQTFRYLEDGSFTTSDEDEYELPENCKIGLVHPIELDEETLSAWKEQLSDYEINQPFLQINRPVYRVLPEEKGKTALERFSGTEINNLSLLGKMIKLEWEKGEAQDAGIFYEFQRTDIAKQEKIGDTIKRTGYYTELQFDGMYIASGYEDSHEVVISDVKFWSNDTLIKEQNALKLEEVSPRYFSEIVAQLMSIFGGMEEKNEE